MASVRMCGFRFPLVSDVPSKSDYFGRGLTETSRYSPPWRDGMAGQEQQTMDQGRMTRTKRKKRESNTKSGAQKDIRYIRYLNKILFPSCLHLTVSPCLCPDSTHLSPTCILLLNDSQSAVVVHSLSIWLSTTHSQRINHEWPFGVSDPLYVYRWPQSGENITPFRRPETRNR